MADLGPVIINARDVKNQGTENRVFTRIQTGIASWVGVLRRNDEGVTFYRQSNQRLIREVQPDESCIFFENGRRIIINGGRVESR